MFKKFSPVLSFSAEQCVWFLEVPPCVLTLLRSTTHQFPSLSFP